MIRDLSLPEDADVVVLGDTAYDAKVVRQACEDRNYLWITPANPERVYEGSKGNRPRLRSRLKDWTGLSLKTIRRSCPFSQRLRFSVFFVRERAASDHEGDAFCFGGGKFSFMASSSS